MVLNPKILSKIGRHRFPGEIRHTAIDRKGGIRVLVEEDSEVSVPRRNYIIRFKGPALEPKAKPRSHSTWIYNRTSPRILPLLMCTWVMTSDSKMACFLLVNDIIKSVIRGLQTAFMSSVLTMFDQEMNSQWDVERWTQKCASENFITFRQDIKIPSHKYRRTTSLSLVLRYCLTMVDRGRTH